MSPITTHVLDTALGKPAAGVPVSLSLESATDGDATKRTFVEIGRGVTDADGRIKNLMPAGSLIAATYRITFDTGAYFAAQGTKAFFPSVSIVFQIPDDGPAGSVTTSHYHVPLLLSPFGYSTYRGS
jgi:5-hydroxyisourate hydrolase